MKNIISWLDGRKTLIGAFLAVVYAGLVTQGVVEANEFAEWVITGVLGVGLADRVRKG